MKLSSVIQAWKSKMDEVKTQQIEFKMAKWKKKNSPSQNWLKLAKLQDVKYCQLEIWSSETLKRVPQFSDPFKPALKKIIRPFNK